MLRIALRSEALNASASLAALVASRGSLQFCVGGHDPMAKHCGLSFARAIDLAAQPFSPAELEACRKESSPDLQGTGVSTTGETSVVGSGDGRFVEL